MHAPVMSAFSVKRHQDQREKNCRALSFRTLALIAALRSSSGKFFIQMFPRLRRLFYMRIRIERHRSNSLKSNTLIRVIVPR
jgi:hypothetical protein